MNNKNINFNKIIDEYINNFLREAKRQNDIGLNEDISISHAYQEEDDKLISYLENEKYKREKEQAEEVIKNRIFIKWLRNLYNQNKLNNLFNKNNDICLDLLMTTEFEKNDPSYILQDV